MAKTKIGKVKILLKGEYNADTQYIRLDGVTYNGSFYICKQDCQGINVDNQEYWQLAAEKGDKPINGVDYNTEEEKTEFKKEIISEGKTQLDEYNVTKKAELDAKEVELEGELTNKKDELIIDIDDTLNGFEDNVEQKVADFNTNASEKTASFNQNAQTQTSAFDSNAETQTEKFNTNATSKTNGFDTNATEKTTSFDTNATEKTTAFDTNATSKTNEYNSNATQLTTQTDDLFDALTTNEASGTELYIEDAKACRVINTEIDGMYKQETTKGYNLFNLNTILSNYYISVTGIVEISNYSNSSDYIEVKANKTYLISYNYNTLSNTAKRRIATYNSDKIFLTAIEYALSQKSVTITPSEDGYIRFSYDINCTDVQVVEGTENKTYEPYTGGNPSPNPDYPQVIEQVESVDLNIGNKNLYKGFNFTKSDKGVTFTYKEDGSISVSGTATALAMSMSSNESSGRTFVLRKGEYTLSGGITSVEIALVQLDGSLFILTDNKKTFTVDEDVTIFLRLNVAKGATLNKIIKPQLEKGTTATTYEPYQNQTIDIDLKGNKLCAVSDTIKDKLLIDRNGNVALQKNIGKLILNGSEKWEKIYGENLFDVQDLQKSGIVFNTGYAKSNYYIYNNVQSSINANLKNGEFALQYSTTTGTRYNVFIRNNNCETIDDFKILLSTNNVEIYYPLKTPELIDLGQLPELPKTFNGINNIWAKTNLGNTEIEIEYVQDVKKLIENLQALALDNATTE